MVHQVKENSTFHPPNQEIPGYNASLDPTTLWDDNLGIKQYTREINFSNEAGVVIATR